MIWKVAKLFAQSKILATFAVELFDSKTQQNAENRTVSNSLLLLLKYLAKSLFLKRLYQTVVNLK